MKKILKYSEIKSKIKWELAVENFYDDKDFEYYDTTLEIEGDFTLDDLSYFERKENSICGFFINGDLIVNGNIINYDEEFGQSLFVTGNVYANNIIGGGGQLQFYGKTFIKYFYLAWYGHGDAYLDNVDCKIAIVSDHATSMKKLNCQVAFSMWQFSPPEEENIHNINELYFSDKDFDFYELLENPWEELLENEQYNMLLLNYFGYEELSYIFEKDEYYKKKFLDVERIKYRNEEDIIEIVDIIDEVLSGKEEPLIEYILEVINNNDFIQELKHRALERYKIDSEYLDCDDIPPRFDRLNQVKEMIKEVLKKIKIHF